MQCRIKCRLEGSSIAPHGGPTQWPRFVPTPPFRAERMPAQALILIRFWRRNSSRPLGFILQSYFALFTKVNSLHSVCCSVTPQTQKSLFHRRQITPPISLAKSQSISFRLLALLTPQMRGRQLPAVSWKFIAAVGWKSMP